MARQAALTWRVMVSWAEGKGGELPEGGRAGGDRDTSDGGAARGNGARRVGPLSFDELVDDERDGGDPKAGDGDENIGGKGDQVKKGVKEEKMCMFGWISLKMVNGVGQERGEGLHCGKPVRDDSSR